jgi:SOS-response transcriptional repressor LexA
MVKRLYRDGELIVLRSENDGYEDIMLSPEAIVVQGRVVYVVHSPRS